jgi:very-short-patch-repair endonuclease
MEERQKRVRAWRGMKHNRGDLRKKMTPAEQQLWKYLRNCREDHIRFRRQHGIGPYVVDFYHAKSMTVIEIDGAVHEDESVIEGDKIRQEYLEFRGYKVIRFRNNQVFNDINTVLKEIKRASRRRL